MKMEHLQMIEKVSKQVATADEVKITNNGDEDFGFCLENGFVVLLQDTNNGRCNILFNHRKQTIISCIHDDHKIFRHHLQPGETKRVV